MKPFPTELFPNSVGNFIRETSHAMQCDPAMVALPVLSTMGAAIGTTRGAHPLPGWVELPIIWTAIIARSGGVKTPPSEAATKPLFDTQHEAFERYKTDLIEHEKKLLHYQKELAKWKRGKIDGSDPPEPPKPLFCVRHLVDDVTLEALAPILQENPRGLLLAPDELDGWVQSFGNYKQRGGVGADRAKWLRLHRKGMLVVDRKTNRQVIYVRPASVCVTGTVQPSIFFNSMRGDNLASGLPARLLLAMPEPRCKKLSKRRVSCTVNAEYAKLIKTLLRSDHCDGEHGPEALLMELSADAFTIFEEFYNRNGILQYEAADDAEAAALAKLEAYALRFAVIFSLIADPHAVEIHDDAMQRGVKLAEWFAEEAARIYGRMGDDDETADLRELVEWIRRKRGAVTARDLVRGPRKYRGDMAKADKVLSDLAEAGFGTYDNQPAGPNGGWDKKIFRLQTHGDGDTCHETGQESAECRRRRSESVGKSEEGEGIDEGIRPLTEEDAEAATAGTHDCQSGEA